MPRRTPLVRSARNRKKGLKSKTSPKGSMRTARFVMCINNEGNPASLESARSTVFFRTQMLGRSAYCESLMSPAQITSILPISL